MLAVIEDRLRQCIEPDQHGSPGRRESGNGLEYRVGHRHDGHVGEIQWQGAGQAETEPERCDYEEAVAEPQILARIAHRVPEDEPDEQRDAETFHEWLPRLFVVDQVDNYRRHHGDAEHHQQQTEDALYN